MCAHRGLPVGDGGGEWLRERAHCGLFLGLWMSGESEETQLMK